MTHFFNLTPGTDNFTGVSNDYNAFQLDATTLQSSDTVTGGAAGAFFDAILLTAAGTIAASQFAGVTNIEQLNLSSAGNNVSLTNGLVAGTSTGFFTVLDGGGDDTVNASAVSTTPIVFYPTTGSDTLKGGGGNDAFVIAAANLTSADTIQGNGGIDNLFFSTAGTVAAAAFTNVSSIEGIGLSSLGNNITLTNALVGSSNNGAFAVADGAGDDTVDASGVTNGIPLSFFASGGSDTFRGGTGPNGYVFQATDLTSADTVQGGSGADNLFISTAGTLSAAAFTNVTGIEGLILANGTNNVTLTNGLVAGTSAGYFAVAGGSGNDTVDASGVTNGTAIAFYGTTGGNDVFTGGNGSDSFLFAAGGLTAADTVVGGGGSDTLWMTTAGTTAIADLANVSGLEGVFLQFGGTFNLANGITGAASFSVAGSSAVDTFDASAVTGYKVAFSGNGGADVLKGGSQDDTFFIADSAFASINGNAGIDRITLTAASQSFNLTANAAKITNLEVIDLNSSLNSTLTLAGTDIALVNASGTSLYVVGDVDDTVNAGNGYTQIASGVVNNAVAPGHTFYEYQHSSGSLLFIDSAITAATATTGNGSANVPEGTAAGASVFNAQQAGATTYVLGGADAALFSIDGTGHISFNTSPDFETPLDQGTNNIYDLTVTSSNGTATPNFVQTVAITVTDVNAAPVFTSGTTGTEAENTPIANVVYDANATDDGENTGSLTYSLSAGGDNDRFNINAATGEVTFKVSPNFEAPTDSNTDNIYNVTVHANDGTLDTTQAVAITVTDVNAAPVFTSGTTGTEAENTSIANVVYDANATDDGENTALVYSLSAGGDNDRFDINASTGEVTFKVSPNFEAPTDANTDNVYDITVHANDGGFDVTQAVAISVTDVNAAPVFTSGTTGTEAENTPIANVVYDANATDDGENTALVYSLSAGGDNDRFDINASTGEVTFKVSPNFEAPTDSNTDNVYNVTVHANDGAFDVTQAVAITVTDVNAAPVFTSGTTGTEAENTPIANVVYDANATDDGENNNTLTYSLSAGGDNDRFDINAATGEVTFKVSPNFEAPTDSNTDNIYNVTVHANDGTLDVTQAVAITVTDVNAAPVFTSGTTGTEAENTPIANVVYDANATDDGENTALVYSLSAGGDNDRFNINAATGEVTFKVSPNFEAPTDSDTDNVYDITVHANDGGFDVTQAVAITVTDVNAAPVFTSGATGTEAENTPIANVVYDANATDDGENTALVYSLSAGGDNDLFDINASTGEVTFKVSPNFEAPTDSDTNNVYDITVHANDGAFDVTQAVAISVTDVNAAPVFTSGTTGSEAENTPIANVVYDANATDDGENTGSLIYSLSAGGDNDRFNINASTGEVTFKVSPNFEAPTDANTDNVYNVTVHANDGAFDVTKAVAITVTNVNAAPVFTSGTTGTEAENTPIANVVYDANATDDGENNNTLTYSLSAGGDNDRFNINAATGEVTFKVSPNFEAPTDANTDNIYNITVHANDGSLDTTQGVAISVTNVNEEPQTTNVTATGNEDPTGPNYIPITLAATDVDAGDTIASYHITSLPTGTATGTLYTDAALTTAVVAGNTYAASGGTLTLYFSPAANSNGSVTFNAAAIDNHSLEDSTPATETINVTAVNDAPVNNGVPASLIVQSGFAQPITGLSISDVDAGSATDLTTTLASAGGTIAVGATAGVVISGSGTGSVTLTGSIATISAALAGNNVKFTATDGAATPTTTSITITTNDAGHTGIDPGLTGTATTEQDSDTIQVAVTPQVWFINGNQVGADASAPRGSQTNPFTDITEFNTASAGANGPGANDYIYLKAGTYTGPGINLKDGQTLLGDDQALSFTNPLPGGGTITIETASGARPTISVTTAGDQAIDLGQNNVIHGINITTASGTTGLDDGQAAAGNAVGTLTVDQMQISGAGQAVDIDQGGALNVSLESVSSTGGTHGIQLAGTASSGAGLLSGSFSAGTGAFAVTSAISGSSTAGILVGDGAGGANTGGTATITYGGTISAANAANVVNIQDHATGAVALSGNLTHTGNGGGIVLDDNSSNFTFSGTTNNLNTGTGTAINITDQTGTNTVAFSGPLNIDTSTGAGINIGGTNASTATFNFTGGSLAIDATGAGNGFAATGGGTVNVTGTGNHIATVGGTALNISNTTIGGSHVTFQDINANGGTNGIVLNTTGTTGHLTVTGDAGSTNNSSGGVIQNTTGAGIRLTSTKDVSFDQMNIHDTDGSGIDGTGVTNFTLTNSTINNSGDGLGGADAILESNIGFNHSASGNSLGNNVNGTVIITGNTLTNAYFSGVDLEGSAGTITNANISNNVITSTTSQTTSKGSGILVNATGDNAGAMSIDAATINNNNVTGFPSGSGIVISGGNASASGIAGHLGLFNDNTKVIEIANNLVQGFSQANEMASFGIAAILTGGNSGSRAEGNFNIHNNGTVANPVKNMLGQAIQVGNNGFSDMRIHTDNNVLAPHNINASQGIGGGNGVSGAGSAWTPHLIWSINGNTISDTDGNGILAVGRQTSGTMDLEVLNNTVATPTSSTTLARRTVEIEAGNAVSTDDAIHLSISGNTVGAGLNGAGGIGLRKQGNVGTTNDFGIFDAAGGPTLNANPTNAEVQTFVQALNPGAAGVDVLQGPGFIRDTTHVSPMLAAAGGIGGSSPGETNLTQAQLDSVVAAAIGQWALAGASASQLAALHATIYVVGDLSGAIVGEQSTGQITIDKDAAGHGWFVDPTPNDNSEFTHAANAAGTDLYTDPSTAAAGHLDLLTAVTHEMGHVLGLDDTTAASDVNDLMYIGLVDGERRLPDAADVAQANEADIPQIMQAPAGTPIVAGNAAGNTIDAGHGGNVLFGGAGADTFVFGPGIQLNAPTPAQITHVADYSAAQGDTFDFTAITSAFHNSNVSDSLVVRAVEDASGKFAMLQVDHIDPMGMPSAPNWVNVAQLDGVHAGDSVTVLIDNHSVHLAQIHVDLLV